MFWATQRVAPTDWDFEARIPQRLASPRDDGGTEGGSASPHDDGGTEGGRPKAGDSQSRPYKTSFAFLCVSVSLW